MPNDARHVLFHRAGRGPLDGIDIVDNHIRNVLGCWSTAENVQPTNSSAIAFNLSGSYAANGWDGVLIKGDTLTNMGGNDVVCIIATRRPSSTTTRTTTRSAPWGSAARTPSARRTPSSATTSARTTAR
jgi:hypothetical protein